MKMKNNRWILAVFAVGLFMGAVRTCVASDLKTQKSSVAVDANRAIAIRANQGEFAIEAGGEGEIAFEVGFKANRSGWFSKKPSAKEIEKSGVFFDEVKGELTVTAGTGLSARAKIAVPKGSALTLNLDTGVLTIAARAGRTEAYVETGMLTFDDAGLPADACVESWVKTGTIDGKTRGRCKTPAASLQVDTGTITVR